MWFEVSGIGSSRKPYPSDVSDEEWALVAPYLTLLSEDCPRRSHRLREVFNGLRYIVKTGAPWRWMPSDLPSWEIVYQQAQRWLRAGCFSELAEDFRTILRLAAGRPEQPTAAIIDSRTLRSTPESGARVAYDGAKRKKGSKLHLAVDTLGHLPALHVTPANADDRAEIGRMAEAIQAATGDSVDSPSLTKATQAQARRGSGPTWHSTSGRQAARGQARLCPAAKAMGRRAIFRPGDPFPTPRQRL